MRICMISSTPIPPREGIGFYVWNLSHYLTALGHQVQIITRGQIGRMTKQVVDGITIWQPPFLPLYPFHVHVHGLFVDKLVQTLANEVDLFHLHTPLPPLISTNRPVMLTVHSPIREDVKATSVDSAYAVLMKLQAPVSYWLEKALLKHATSVNAVSPEVANALSTYPNSPSKVSVTWNGVDTSLFTSPAHDTRDSRLVLTVARLAPGKGIEQLLQAAKMLNQRGASIQFVIAGDGPLRRSLQQYIEQNDLAQTVELLGHVADRKKLVELYQKASLFVMPSHHEGLPTVLLEAMACRCPVVATRVGGVPNVIHHQKNGILIPAKASQKLADAIFDLIEQPQRLRQLGEQASQTIKEKFSWHTIGHNYVAQYESLLQGGAS